MLPSLETLGIDKLSYAERIDLIGAIWDTLPDSSFVFPNESPIPLMEQRLAEAIAKPEELLTWDQLHAELGRKP
jgi:putative addiction module component (TIGR02574 family)